MAGYGQRIEKDNLKRPLPSNERILPRLPQSKSCNLCPLQDIRGASSRPSRLIQPRPYDGERELEIERSLLGEPCLCQRPMLHIMHVQGTARLERACADLFLASRFCHSARTSNLSYFLVAHTRHMTMAQRHSLHLGPAGSCAHC